MSSAETPLPPPQQNVKPKDYYAKLANRTRNTPSMSTRQVSAQETDALHSPCEDASKASLACMDQNGHNRDKCMEYFRAYKDCKRAWVRLVSSCSFTPLTRLHIVVYQIEQRRADRQRGRETPI
ncbi:hypothetical protein JVU11DRAFT_6420 [Chiua virens]|nr:hypothetical protein JVU11DRAFT_6420 [Chiua virens]